MVNVGAQEQGFAMFKAPELGKPTHSAPGLNIEHPSLNALSVIAKVEERVLTGLVENTFLRVNEAVQEIFPQEKPLKEKNLKALPAYRVTIVSEKKPIDSDKPKVGIIYLPQTGGTSAGSAPLVAEIFKENRDQKTDYKSLKDGAEMNVKFAASLSSSVSIDTQSQPLSDNPVERAAIQAAAIFQIIQENPCQKIVLAGHSLGGMELPYVTAILQKLMVKNGLSTEIGGMIMLESGSMYSQSRWDIITKRLPQFKSGAVEEKLLYPHKFDLEDAQEQIRHAQTVEQDAGKVLRLQAKFDAMKENYDNPPGLTKEEIIKLRDIDEAIVQAAIDNNAIGIGLLQRLRYRTLDSPLKIEMKKRLAFLKPKIGEKIQGAEKRIAGTPVIASIKATFNIIGELEVARPMAQRVRDSIKDVNVAVVFGDEDPYFPGSEANRKMTSQEIDTKVKMRNENLQSRTEEELKKLSRFFPNARRYIEATVTNFSHRSPVVSSDKTADILVDIVKRMLNPKSPNLTKERLFYAIGPTGEAATA